MPRSRVSQLAAMVVLVMVALVLALASTGEVFGGDGGGVSAPIDFHFGW